MRSVENPSDKQCAFIIYHGLLLAKQVFREVEMKEKKIFSTRLYTLMQRLLNNCLRSLPAVNMKNKSYWIKGLIT
jgi:hypothetical protein